MKVRVYWITGLSGAGKTTIATHLRDRLRAAGTPVVLLDGDRLRAIIAPQAGHQPEERRNLAFSYSRLCCELARQDVVAVCATISMFHDVRDWSRANIPGYFEVYLKVPLEVRQARDAKGLYSGGAEIVGANGDFEEPQSPDVIIINNGSISPNQAVDLILAKAGTT